MGKGMGTEELNGMKTNLQYFLSLCSLGSAKNSCYRTVLRVRSAIGLE